MIDIITIRGTGEPLGGSGNMLRNVVDHLDRSRYRYVGDCPYPATVGPAGAGLDVDGPSETTSRAYGVAALAAMIRNAPNPVGIITYSLGALVLDDFRAIQARGAYLDCEVAFSAAVANPARRAGESIDDTSYGYGINGPRDDFAPGPPHFEAANPEDVITSCPLGSPLRALADGMSAFSFAELGGWSQDMAERLRQCRFQPVTLGWWQRPVETWRLYEETYWDIIGYLNGREHIAAYIDDGYCSRLADRINALDL
ncbi:PE-PPE domain-containing protein [Nocardia nova]|uniref:PE-PPE domain-containing protein n=1 Tax=Nocardia nova TaxID=37330 RepID=A0A2S6ACN8_9NOCA|nr:PE-PPE domain-containing protein [Nocardia nova]PPJ31858.1 PE-PPE domain-containing protein [Nocardia nova]